MKHGLDIAVRFIWHKLSVLLLLLCEVFGTQLADIDLFELTPLWNGHPQDISLFIQVQLDHIVETFEEAAITLTNLISEHSLDERKLRERYLHQSDCLCDRSFKFLHRKLFTFWQISINVWLLGGFLFLGFGVYIELDI